jgi:hypothetical protein
LERAEVWVLAILDRKVVYDFVGGRTVWAPA